MEDIEHFECRCFSPEHSLRFWLHDDNPPDLFISVFLGEEPWYRRIWLGLKYIFGYKCSYGHFDEFLLKPEDCDRFMNLLQRFKELSSK